MGNQVNKLLKLHIKYVLVSSTEDSKTLDLYQDIISYKIIKPLILINIFEVQGEHAYLNKAGSAFNLK